MLSNLTVLTFAGAVVLLWMLIPLLVAVVIHHLAPDKEITARGPLHGLNIKAHGPFVVYLVVLLGSAAIWWKAFDVTIGMSKTKWTVTARVSLIDRQQNPVAADTARQMQRMHVKFDFPQAIVSGYDRISVQVPGNIQNWPDLVIHVPEFGERIIYLNDLSTRAAKIDHSTATVELDDVIVVTERQAEPIGVGMSAQ
jgi:hypothetical protein